MTSSRLSSSRKRLNPWLPAYDRFMLCVVEGRHGHWLWTGTISKKTGYGQFSQNYERWLAHRWSYTTFVGLIPWSKQLDHTCRVRHCVSPGHLEIVTCQQNLLRSMVTLAGINAQKTHCPRGHPYHPVRTSGHRVCRICAYIRDPRYKLGRKPKSQAFPGMLVNPSYDIIKDIIRGER